jgi:hypothetical protein
MFAFLRSLIRKWREYSEANGDQLKRRRIYMEQGGFRVESAIKLRPVFRVRWAEIQAIETYKRDILVHDMICLSFSVSDNLHVELWESDEGFSEISTEMMRLFPSIPSDWFADVMIPAFETNHRELYRRAGVLPQAG